MDYIQVTFRTDKCEEYTSDLLAAELADIGFESFEETNRGIIAYCPSPAFSEEAMVNVIKNLEISNPSNIAYRIDTIADRNWNAEWEQNGYEPIVIDSICCIHASNHPIDQKYEYDLTIDPVQSFGTGYHQTTRMILGWMLNDICFDGLNVLDMGCGTGVLGILAAKCGANVVAIDIDQWAWQNAIDNSKANNVDNIEIYHGDASILDSMKGRFDVILANINRNILVADMARYDAAMTPDGILVTSGYFEPDLKYIIDAANKNGIHYLTHQNTDEWTAAVFRKGDTNFYC